MNSDTSASLFVLLVAAIGVAMLIWIVPAPALECKERPDGKSYWSYRIIDGERCWYRGEGRKPKSSLHWPDEPKPKRIKGDPLFNAIRADAGLDAVTWHMARAFDEARPLKPPPVLLPEVPDDVWPELSEFDRRFVGVQP